jgi:hypothetical protein
LKAEELVDVMLCRPPTGPDGRSSYGFSIMSLGSDAARACGKMVESVAEQGVAAGSLHIGDLIESVNGQSPFFASV